MSKVINLLKKYFSMGGEEHLDKAIEIYESMGGIHGDQRWWDIVDSI